MSGDANLLGYALTEVASSGAVSGEAKSKLNQIWSKEDSLPVAPHVPLGRRAATFSGWTTVPTHRCFFLQS